MNKRQISMKHLISQNKREILSSKEELERIEKKIDEKHHRRLLKMKEKGMVQ